MSAALALWDRVFDATAPDWEIDGRDWPNRAASRFVTAGGLRFHVQVMGAGPVLLLLHGTGAATHSWRALAPLLARDFTVIAPDLPGHGFTAAPFWPRMSLPGMAGAIAALLDVLEAPPALVAGHSAGAAILAEMCLQGRIAPAGLVSLNGALLPLKGVAGQVFSPLARLFALNPLVPRVFAWHAADKAVVARLLRGTGSRIDAQGAEFYARLARRSGHAGAALMMMANWDLAPLAAALPRLAPRLLLIVGAADRSIPPADAREIARLVPGARVIVLPRLGHLAHEEAPEPVAGEIAGFAREIGVLAA
jgi:magnesium chelatase accessory protein